MKQHQRGKEVSVASSENLKKPKCGHEKFNMTLEIKLFFTLNILLRSLTSLSKTPAASYAVGFTETKEIPFVSVLSKETAEASTKLYVSLGRIYADLPLGMQGFKGFRYHSARAVLYDVLHTGCSRPNFLVFLHIGNNKKCDIFLNRHTVLYPTCHTKLTYIAFLRFDYCTEVNVSDRKFLEYCKLPVFHQRP